MLDRFNHQTLENDEDGDQDIDYCHIEEIDTSWVLQQSYFPDETHCYEKVPKEGDEKEDSFNSSYVRSIHSQWRSNIPHKTACDGQVTQHI